MEPEDTPPMSGSNCICVSTVLLDSGIIPMQEPVTHLTLEAPAGLIEVSATCRNGKAESITLTNVPSFAPHLEATLDVEGVGKVKVDTAFGGDSFVMADVADFGLPSRPRTPMSSPPSAASWSRLPTSNCLSTTRTCRTGSITPSAFMREPLERSGWRADVPQFLRGQSRQARPFPHRHGMLCTDGGAPRQGPDESRRHLHRPQRHRLTIHWPHCR
jgi:hypothetical protein